MPELIADLPAIAILLPAACVYCLWALFHWVFKTNDSETLPADTSALPGLSASATGSAGSTLHRGRTNVQPTGADNTGINNRGGKPTTKALLPENTHKLTGQTRTDSRVANTFESAATPHSITALDDSTRQRFVNRPVGNTLNRPQLHNPHLHSPNQHSNDAQSASPENRNHPSIAAGDESQTVAVAGASHEAEDLIRELPDQTSSDLPVVADQEHYAKLTAPGNTDASAKQNTSHQFANEGDASVPVQQQYKTAAKRKSAPPTAEVTLQLKASDHPIAANSNSRAGSASSSVPYTLLKEKDQKIKSLETQLKALQKQAENQQNEGSTGDNATHSDHQPVVTDASTDSDQHNRDDIASQLVISERKVAQLRSTVNHLQATVLSDASAAAQTDTVQQSRPSLLSKVRLVTNAN